MKLNLLGTPSSSPVAQSASTPLSPYDGEMDSLCQRLVSNSFGDSDSVRQVILGRMVYLTFKQLMALNK